MIPDEVIEIYTEIGIVNANRYFKSENLILKHFG
jgi:hypothetical protein